MRWKKSATDGVEGRGIDTLVDLVCTGNRVRGEEGNDLEGREVAGIFETRENLGNIVLGLGNQALDGSDGLVRAAGQEFETGSTLR